MGSRHVRPEVVEECPFDRLQRERRLQREGRLFGPKPAPGFLQSTWNPLSRNGPLARMVERVPGFNNAMQVVHLIARDEEALQRARRRNPLSSGGYVWRGAECVPLLNNMVQHVHAVRGNSQDLERAKSRNPLGHNGYMTRLGEHIPGLADTICCIHRFRGLETEAERARAFSLQRMVGRRGAITKLAELLPGTHLVAAALAELKGDREEAIRALNLIRQWKDVATADGALARFAELVPGLDIIQFGLMANAGQYAYAVRAICKTRWVAITAGSSALVIESGRSRDWVVAEVESDLRIEPKAPSLAGGLLDLFIHLLHFDGHGRERWGRNQPGPYRRRRPSWNAIQDKKLFRANEELRAILEHVTESAPDYVRYLVELTNWSVYEWQAPTRFSNRIMWMLYVLFPPMRYQPSPSKAPSAIFAEAFQASLSEVAAHHGPMPLSPDEFSIPLRKRNEADWQEGVPEAAAAVSCLSGVGCLCCGLHLFGFGACLAGTATALSAAKRTLKQNLIPWLNKSNAAVWRWMSDPVRPLLEQQAEEPDQDCRFEASRKLRGSMSGNSFFSILSSCDSCEEGEESVPVAEGIVFDWSKEVMQELRASEKLRDYFMSEFLSVWRPLNWCHPAVWILQLFERQLRCFMHDALDGQTVPLVIPIPLQAGKYEGSQVWLPEIRVMLVLWCAFSDKRYISRVTVAMVDGTIDQIANSLKAQLMPDDLRDADPRLAGFTQPIDANFNIALKWTASDKLRIEMNDLHVKLHLPN